MNKAILILLSLLLSNFLYAQEITQTIKGKVIDSETQIELPGATIIVVNSNPIMGTTTDIEGNFRLKNVPVGRISLQISFIGYNNQYVSGLLA